MTWIKFMLWLCGCYAGYYVALISWDLFGKRTAAPGSLSHELTFVEDIEPIHAGAEDIVLPAGPAVISSGGVSLKHLFSLAREEAIVYTRPVSF